MERPQPRRQTATLRLSRSAPGGPGVYSRQAGFSLIELIIIIVIIGVLSVFAIPRFNYSGSQVAAVSRKMVEDIRYAQGRAVATQVTHGVIFSGCSGGANCTSYRVSEFDGNKNATVPAKDPLSGQDFDVQMAGPYDAVEISTTLSNQMIQFDAGGVPCGGVGAGCVTMTTATNAITVTKGGCHLQLTVTTATGLVDTEPEVQC